MEMKRLMINKSKNTLLIVCVLILACTLLCACGNRPNKNGSKRAEDGRSYGGVITGEVEDKMETVFFDFTVSDATRYDTHQFQDGLYQAEEGNTYLVVTISITNTYDEDIAMSIADFTLDYKGNDSEDVITGYGKAEIGQDQFMDNIFTLKQDETITKSILYTVKNKKNYTLRYREYYEDDFKGDTFEVQLTPMKKDSQNTTTEENNTSENNTSESNTSENNTQE